MKRYWIYSLTVIALTLAMAASASATTYYVAANGADSNSGTSKTSPWAHLPGMATWSGGHVPTAGDTFVLRGCDTWGNSNFPINWKWSGSSSSSQIVVDRDTSWYNTANCSSWNRPVFDAGLSAINAPDCPSGSGSHWFLNFTSSRYVTMHWIEMKGLYWNNDQQNSCYESAGFIRNTASDYLTIDNFYFHGWKHGTSAGTTDSSTLIAFTVYGTAPYCFNCYLQYSVINNSDGDGASASTLSGGGVRNWNVTYNIFSHVVQAYLSPGLGAGTITIAGNDISYIGMSFTSPAQSVPPHPNCIETTGMVGGATGTFLIHDNYIHNIQTCEGLQVGNPNENDYVWNNIWDMGATSVGGVNGPQVPQGSSSGAFFFANNIVRWASGCMVAGGHGTSFSSFVVQNNQCINDNSIVVNGSIPSARVSSNIAMTNSTASGQGYTSTERYVYSPTASTNTSVGAGANLTSASPGCGTAGLSSLCSDTVYAVSQQTISGVVQAVTSGRATVSRASSGSWDAGAYRFASGGAPNPPSLLSGAVR